MGSVSGVRRLKTFQHCCRFQSIYVIFISAKVDLAPSFSLGDYTPSSLMSPRTQSSKILHLNRFIWNYNPGHFWWGSVNYSFIVVVSVSISRSWMFAGQMNLDTIGSSSRDCHTLKHFHFTADFLSLLGEIASLFTPKYPLRFLRGSQNRGQLGWWICTAQHCLLIRTSNLAAHTLQRFSTYFHCHVSRSEAFRSQAIVCNFPMINIVITQTGLIYEEIYMPAEAAVLSSAREMEWELPPV